MVLAAMVLKALTIILVLFLGAAAAQVEKPSAYNSRTFYVPKSDSMIPSLENRISHFQYARRDFTKFLNFVKGFIHELHESRTEDHDDSIGKSIEEELNEEYFPDHKHEAGHTHKPNQPADNATAIKVNTSDKRKLIPAVNKTGDMDSLEFQGLSVGNVIAFNTKDKNETSATPSNPVGNSNVTEIEVDRTVKNESSPTDNNTVIETEVDRTVKSESSPAGNVIVTKTEVDRTVKNESNPTDNDTVIETEINTILKNESSPAGNNTDIKTEIDTTVKNESSPTDNSTVTKTEVDRTVKNESSPADNNTVIETEIDTTAKNESSLVGNSTITEVDRTVKEESSPTSNGTKRTFITFGETLAAPFKNASLKWL